MQIKSFICAVSLGLLLAGCYTKDITKNPSSKTDFVVGAIYTLKWPALITGNFLTPAEYPGTATRKSAPPDWFIEAGTRFIIRKIINGASPEIGTFTDVHAEVLDGPFKGRQFNVIWISTHKTTGETLRDPRYFDEGVPP